MGLSRNKVAVGESAAGSPPKAAHKRVLMTPYLNTGNSLSIGNRKTVKPIVKDSWAIRDHEKGLVDQLEDRRLCKAEALGSSPSESIEPRIEIRGI